MSDELDAFSDSYAQDDDGGAQGLLQRALLVFQLGSEQYAVSAATVDAVIPWRDPIPLPRTSDYLAGVVQDRGRIVAILHDPLGRPKRDDSPRARIVICSSPWGFVGLPATATRVVGDVVVAAEPRSGRRIDSAEGPLTYIDLAPILEALRSDPQRGGLRVP